MKHNINFIPFVALITCAAAFSEPANASVVEAIGGRSETAGTSFRTYDFTVPLGDDEVIVKGVENFAEFSACHPGSPSCLPLTIARDGHGLLKFFGEEAVTPGATDSIALSLTNEVGKPEYYQGVILADVKSVTPVPGALGLFAGGLGLLGFLGSKRGLKTRANLRDAAA